MLVEAADNSRYQHDLVMFFHGQIENAGKLLQAGAVFQGVVHHLSVCPYGVWLLGNRVVLPELSWKLRAIRRYNNPTIRLCSAVSAALHRCLVAPGRAR